MSILTDSRPSIHMHSLHAIGYTVYASVLLDVLPKKIIVIFKTFHSLQSIFIICSVENFIPTR